MAGRANHSPDAQALPRGRKADVTVDSHSEGTGDLDQACETDTGIVICFVTLNGLLGEPEASSEFALSQTTRNPRSNQRCRELRNVGGLNQGGIVEGVKLGKLTFKIAKYPSQCFELHGSHLTADSFRQDGALRISKLNPDLVGFGAGNSVLTFVLDHDPKSSASSHRRLSSRGPVVGELVTDEPPDAAVAAVVTRPTETSAKI